MFQTELLSIIRMTSLAESTSVTNTYCCVYSVETPDMLLNSVPESRHAVTSLKERNAFTSNKPNDS